MFWHTKFQFTPLREGRHNVQSAVIIALYFNSRPSARGDYNRCKLPRRNNISIHAPPRGATLLKYVNCVCDIFQFTPLREGRLNIVHTPFTRISFQFTPLREGRLPSP